MEAKTIYQLPQIINLNVGGVFFTTRLSTLRKYENSMLAAKFSERHRPEKDKDGNYFLDMDGTRFKHILNFLRNENHLPPRNITQEVLEDAMYLGIHPLVERLRSLDHCWDSLRTSVPDYTEMKEKIIKLGETVDVNPDIPTSWKFNPHVILDFLVEKHVKINQACYEKCQKIDKQGTIEIKCESYEDAVELAGCLFKDILNDGYNVKMEELFPCVVTESGTRPESETESVHSETDTSEGIPEGYFNNFRYMFIFEWCKRTHTDC